MEMTAHVTQLLQSLAHFKDWSNYMLVTTVAALGWVASKKDAPISGGSRSLTIWCLALSIVFAIFTLALIPIVAEGVREDTKSFYDVPARFNLVWFLGPEIPLKLKWVCWWQHVLFLVGVMVYAYANTHSEVRGSRGTKLAITGLVLALLGTNALWAYLTFSATIT